MITQITELLNGIEYSSRGNLSGIPDVTSLVYDSRKAESGSLFFCLPGAKADGHDYAPKAYSLGARAFIVERFLDLPEDTVQIKVGNARLTLAKISANFYGRPADKMTIIGITGTKGKTTTAVLIKKILCGCGKPCGYIGTIGVEFADKHYETVNSTPESLDLHRYFAMMYEAGCKYAVIEVSSQALDHCRVHGIPFDIAIFTNLSPDHIGGSEHASFEEYREAKHKLFRDYGAADIICNVDDENCRYMLEGSYGKITSYSIEHEADYTAQDITQYRDTHALGISYIVDHFGGRTPVSMCTPGNFSAYNGLAAIAAVGKCGVSPEDAAEILKTAYIDGRVEVVNAVSGITFVIDYAHNGFSLTSTLSVLREYDHNRLICVFGSVGGRTYGRRKEMAEASASLADFTVVTSDNPDCEDPDDIVRDIASHFPEGASYTLIPDRAEAVKFAVNYALEGDIVLFAGKGHENYQLINGERVPFCEKELILKYAKERQ